jgi:hypothetical protein
MVMNARLSSIDTLEASIIAISDIASMYRLGRMILMILFDDSGALALLGILIGGCH